MPLSHKQLAVTFIRSEGAIDGSGANSVRLSGQLRAQATIVEAGGPSRGLLDLSVYGMSLSNMNAFSTLGMIAQALRKNQVILEAGDTTNGMAVVFEGIIVEAWADFQGMPEVAFRVSGFAAGAAALQPIPPTSFSGLVDVATAIKGMAYQAGFDFTNDGVDAQLIDPYFPGSAWEQISRCAEAAHINFGVFNNTVAIWPKGGARGELSPIVSAETGMVGYPTFTANGIEATTLYNPSIGFGQRVQVQSTLPGANGTWIVNALTHSLEAETPGGRWFTTFKAAAPGLAVIQR